MKELPIEEKAHRYDEAYKVAENIHRFSSDIAEIKRMEQIFPELKESEDERIRTAIIHFISHTPTVPKGVIDKETMLAWLQKQGEEKSNPYSGTSFEYNSHIWGMCARDNGVEILFDGELKAFLSSEKSFIYPIHPQPELASKSAMEAINEEKVDNANKVEQKPAWREEDKRILQGIIDEIQANKNNAPDYDLATYDRFLSWLKSLKDRYTWKPSDEQLEALKNAIHIKPFENPSDNLLWGLYEQLKKLKG